MQFPEINFANMDVVNAKAYGLGQLLVLKSLSSLVHRQEVHDDFPKVWSKIFKLD